MSNIGYRDLPEVYIKHRDVKESIIVFLGLVGGIGGIGIGFLSYFMLLHLPIHPRPLFAFLIAFGYVYFMVVHLIPKLEKRWNMQDKSINEQQNLRGDKQ